MPNLAISEYPQASPLELADQVIIERGGSANFRASISQIIDAHGIVDHPDTDATGAQLNALTDGGSADGLHTHSLSPHTIASHVDTDATGSELNTLTDGSNADALHSHAGPTGSGTLNTIPKWGVGGDTLEDSIVFEFGSALFIKGSVEITDERPLGAVDLFVRNTDSTNSASDAHITIRTEGASAGDPLLTFSNLVQSYILGLDNSDSDKFVGSVGADLGTANWIEVTTAGAVLLTGVLSAGSGSTTLTTAAGLLRHQAINPAIAGSGLSVAGGVLSVDAHAPTAHTIASHSDTSATGSELDALTGGGSTTLHSHAAPAHTIASHSDTSATGSELDALTGGGVTGLHTHSSLAASDGSPDPALSMDAAGNVTLATNVDFLIPAGTLTVKNIGGPAGPIVDIIQDFDSGDQPALRIQQDDISKGFINFVGSARGAVAPPIMADSFRVEVNGVVRVIGVYADQ